MKIASEIHDDYIIFHIEGSLSIEHLSDFEDILQSHLKYERHLVLDLTEVRFIDSSSLGIIVLFFTKLRDIQKHLLLTNIKNDIFQMFNLTGISKQIHCFKTIDEALSFLNK